MLDRRKFLTASTAMPLLLAAPTIALGQEETPDFEIAGSIQTDPPGYEVAWSDDWKAVDVSGLTFNPVPGRLGYIVLDLDVPMSDERNQRIVIESHAAAEVIDPAWLIESFADNHPETDMGYAPGTVVETRKVTDQGCWFSFGAGEDSVVPGVIGLSLYYTPTTPGVPLVNVIFNIHRGINRATSEHLELIDSTISLDGDWLLGMDDLDAYWEALENSIGFDF